MTLNCFARDSLREADIMHEPIFPKELWIALNSDQGLLRWSQDGKSGLVNGLEYEEKVCILDFLNSDSFTFSSKRLHPAMCSKLGSLDLIWPLFIDGGAGGPGPPLFCRK